MGFRVSCSSASPVIHIAKDFVELGCRAPLPAALPACLCPPADRLFLSFFILQVWEAEVDEEKYFYHIDVINSWDEEKRKYFMNLAYQIDDDVYCSVPEGVESDKAEYMNHCCDANTLFINDRLMIASRTIEPGDEVTYDYACSETPSSSHMPFKCLCGTAACRGTITGYDLLKPEVREKYKGHFTVMADKFQKRVDSGEIKVPEGAL
jgi:hypothetical protein